MALPSAMVMCKAAVNASNDAMKIGVIASPQLADTAYMLPVREARKRVASAIGIPGSRTQVQPAALTEDNSRAETAELETHARRARRQQNRRDQHINWSPNSSYRAAMSAATSPILSSIPGSFMRGTGGGGRFSDRDHSSSEK